MNRKGFTLIELLIVIAIIGILAGIVIVSLSGSTDNAEDSATKANLRSVATLYAEVFAEQNKAASLCDNTKVQSAMNKVFGGTTGGTLAAGTSADVFAVGTVDAETLDGCASTDSGSWVVWSDLSGANGRAWCIDSDGFNGQVVANDGNDDEYEISHAALTGGTAVNCDSIKK